jgi:hypothetical protein
MLRPLVLALTLAMPGAALAQVAPAGASPSATPPQRIRNVQLQQGQACPRGSSTEIVVCSTLEEPYRIPKQFRDEGPVPAQNQSWTNTAAAIDQESKRAAGLPDTCSPIGSGGQTGCALQQNRAWAAEKRAQRSAAQTVPGGE